MFANPDGDLLGKKKASKDKFNFEFLSHTSMD